MEQGTQSIALAFIFFLGWQSIPAAKVGSYAEFPGLPSRTWQPKPVTCHLVYIKVHKCASTTNSGIARKIGDRLGLKGVHDKDFQASPTGCRVLAGHASARSGKHMLDLYHSDTRPSIYLYTFLRVPDARAMSMFAWFEAGKEHTRTDSQMVIHFLQSRQNVNYMTKYIQLSGTDESCDSRSGNHNRCVQLLLDDYDFIGVVERENESLVAMKILMGLSMEDIVHFNAKDADSRCSAARTSSFYSAPVQEYLRGPFRTDNTLDFALYEAANKSLDETILWIGDQIFREELSTFEFLLQVARTKFTGLAHDDCYYGTWPCGAGCGHSCLSFTVKEHFSPSRLNTSVLDHSTSVRATLSSNAEGVEQECQQRNSESLLRGVHVIFDEYEPKQPAGRANEITRMWLNIIPFIADAVQQMGGNFTLCQSAQTSEEQGRWASLSGVESAMACSNLTWAVAQLSGKHKIVIGASSRLATSSNVCNLLPVYDDGWQLVGGQEQRQSTSDASRTSLAQANGFLCFSESTAAALQALHNVEPRYIASSPCRVSSVFKPVPRWLPSDLSDLFEDHQQIDWILNSQRRFLLLVVPSTAAPDQTGCGLFCKALTQMPPAFAAEISLITLGDSALTVSQPVGFDVLALGEVPEEALPELYSKAAALVYSERGVGVGLAPLEAMACGCPVIVLGAQDETMMHAVLGEDALYAPDAATMAAALWRVWQEQLPPPEQLVARAAAFGGDARSGWDVVARDLLEYVLRGPFREVQGSQCLELMPPEGPACFSQAELLDAQPESACRLQRGEAGAEPVARLQNRVCWNQGRWMGGQWHSSEDCKGFIAAYISSVLPACSVHSILFLGDSNMRYLSEAYASRAGACTVTREAVNRCSFAEYIGMQRSANWVQPHPDKEGPVTFGQTNPFCTDHQSKAKQWVCEGDHGMRKLEHLPVGYARSVELQSPTFASTQQNVVEYLKKEAPRDVCVVSHGLHELKIANLSDAQFVSNVRWHLKLLRPVCKRIVWIGPSAVMESRVHYSSANYPSQNNANVRRLKELAEELLTSEDLGAVGIDVYNMTFDDSLHQDWVHLVPHYYTELASMIEGGGGCRGMVLS